MKRDETRLTRLIEQLAKALARPAKPRSLRQSRSEPRLRNERVPERDFGGPFAQLRGRLALPVKGELASRFGSPREDGGVVWKGLFIAARAGEEVRAIAAGRVVFADWLRGFGNLLIIDHGDGCMSLYGYNERSSSGWATRSAAVKGLPPSATPAGTPIRVYTLK
ncbi:MAG: murein hydrolase activator EnvC family protein [Burkholderiales bacterium]